jgi:hypothetical protein
MAATNGGLTTSIRRKLQEGKTPEEIVQELVAGGLGQASAQRFVDRALADTTPLSAAAAAANAPDQTIVANTAEIPAAQPVSHKTLWYACGLMCLGIGITGFSYANAGPGEPYTVMWGPVAFGLFLWGKAVFAGLAAGRSFGWSSAIVSLAVPIALTVGLRAYVGEAEPAARQTRIEIGAADVSRLLARYESAESATAKCDAVDGLGGARGDDAIAAVDKLMAYYAVEDAPVQYCIRNLVRRLDSEVKFAENGR